MNFKYKECVYVGGCFMLLGQGHLLSIIFHYLMDVCGGGKN